MEKQKVTSIPFILSAVKNQAQARENKEKSVLSRQLSDKLEVERIIYKKERPLKQVKDLRAVMMDCVRTHEIGANLKDPLFVKNG